MFKFVINILNEIKDLFSSLDILIDTKNKRPKIVFFSESKMYQKFSKPIIDSLFSMYSEQIYYFSIDKKDKINNKKTTNYYVHPFLLNYIFNNLKAENLFLIHCCMSAVLKTLLCLGFFFNGCML